MTFKRHIGSLSLLAAALALSGCPGTGENSVDDGLIVHLAEVHMETKPGDTPAGTGEIPNASDVRGGYDESNLEHHDIRDGNGNTLSIYRAYLVLDDLELVPCASLAQVPRMLLDVLIPAARAHSGHGGEPVGGRALDKPNVIDIVTQDGFILPLGDMAVAPGSYCGLRVSLVRLAGDSYGKPVYSAASSDDPTTVAEVPDLAGRMFSIRADYCAETNGSGECARRAKVDIDDNGLDEPAARTIAFDQPLEVNANLREAYVALGIAYGEWAREVDITRLASDPAEPRTLLNNIAGSLYIHGKGLGDPPLNTSQQ